VFGQSERKAMAMALCDRALRGSELGEDIVAPAQDEEFVLSHSDNVQATGFVEHIKLPHYVDFQAELGLVRRMRAEMPREDEARSATDAKQGGGGMTRRRPKPRPTISPISTSRPSG
jgi:alpha-D-ribose 1-methylphosphonate 5-triphosphate synthase subunit PhnI